MRAGTRTGFAHVWCASTRKLTRVGPLFRPRFDVRRPTMPTTLTMSTTPNATTTTMPTMLAGCWREQAQITFPDDASFGALNEDKDDIIASALMAYNYTKVPRCSAPLPRHRCPYHCPISGTISPSFSSSSSPSLPPFRPSAAAPSSSTRLHDVHVPGVVAPLRVSHNVPRGRCLRRSQRRFCLWVEVCLLLWHLVSCGVDGMRPNRLGALPRSQPHRRQRSMSLRLCR